MPGFERSVELPMLTHTVSPRLHVKMKKNWGVVQLVGQLTVNASEAVSQGQARGRSEAKIVSVSAHSGRSPLRVVRRVHAWNRKPN